VPGCEPRQPAPGSPWITTLLWCIGKMGAASGNLENGFIPGCAVCAMKGGYFYLSSFAFPVVFPLHSRGNWSLF